MIYMQQKHVIMTTVGRTLCSSKLSKFIAMLPQALIRHLISLWKTSLVTTFMRYGHGPNGFIGITLNEKAVHKWAMSLHICSRLMKDVADLKDSSSVEITSHKEELASRVKYDENDRQVIREKLQTCIDPLNTASHLVNIVTGHICTDEVNVHNAIDLGKSQMKEYEASWPAGFH